MQTTDTRTLDPQTVIKALGLQPHPEGGHYRETFRDDTRAPDGPLSTRAPSTAIYYLLKEGERSHWHRVDAAEVWHWYAGSPLQLSLAQTDEDNPAHILLGSDIMNGERPQVVVPAHVWQAAETKGAWTLVGCTVAPGFEFQHFELASPGWQPGNQ